MLSYVSQFISNILRQYDVLSNDSREEFWQFIVACSSIKRINFYALEVHFLLYYRAHAS